MLVFAMGEMPSVGNIARFLVRLALCYSIDIECIASVLLAIL